MLFCSPALLTSFSSTREHHGRAGGSEPDPGVRDRSEVQCAHCPIFWSLSTSGGFQATVATGRDVRPTELALLGCAQTWLCPEASSQLPSAGPGFGLVLGGGNQVESVIAYSQLLVILCGHPVAGGGGAGRPGSAAEARNFCESTRRALLLPDLPTWPSGHVAGGQGVLAPFPLCSQPCQIPRTAVQSSPLATDPSATLVLLF